MRAYFRCRRISVVGSRRHQCKAKRYVQAALPNRAIRWILTCVGGGASVFVPGPIQAEPGQCEYDGTQIAHRPTVIGDPDSKQLCF